MPFRRHRISALTVNSNRVLIWAAVGTIALASCTSTGDDSTPKPAQPRALRFAVVEPTTLDPAQAADPEAVSLAELTSLPLVTLDAATSLPRPGLARSWRADAAQQTFTFRLDPSKQIGRAHV